MTGGAAAFKGVTAVPKAPGDSVVVMRKFDGSKIYVIGHVGDKRRCRYVRITFKSVVVDAHIITMAVAREAELDRYKTFATQYRDEFIPALLSYYNSWVGKPNGGLSWIQI